MECLRVGRPKEALNYIGKCPAESKFGLYVNLAKQSQLHIREIGEIALQARDAKLLEELAKIANNPMTREEMLSKAGSLVR